MTIDKKMFLSSFIINIIAMLSIGFLLSFMISGFIRKNAENQLKAQNDIMKRFVTIERVGNRKAVNLLGIARQTGVQNILIYKSKFTEDVQIKPETNLSDEDVSESFEREENQVYSMTIEGTWYLAYTSKVSTTTDDVVVLSIIPNQEVRLLMLRMIIVIAIIVAVTIVVISLFSIYLGMRITKPIKQLTSATKKISNHDYGAISVIETGDEIEELSKSMVDMAKSIEQYNKEQRKFYENVSHELKTPLTVIGGYAEGIKTQIFKDDQQALDTIIDETKHLKKQLEDIIYLSKMETLKDHFNPEIEFINPLISEALRRIESIAILNDVDLYYSPKEDIELSMDSRQILRLLMNVFTNCLKYTKDEIRLKTNINHEGYEIIIEDNGVGFTDEILQSPFNRLKLDNKEGNGIGLSIAKKICEMHGGHFSIYNNMSGSAGYKILLPLPKNK